MRYMVIERFEPAAAPAIYERVRTHGRMLPTGLNYVDSWIADTLDRCFQVMECDDRGRLDEWTSHWSDLVQFEIVPVLSSAEARQRALGGTSPPPPHDRV